MIGTRTDQSPKVGDKNYGENVSSNKVVGNFLLACSDMIFVNTSNFTCAMRLWNFIDNIHGRLEFHHLSTHVENLQIVVKLSVI